VSEGRAPHDAAFIAAMDACIQCRGCEAACPSGVQFGHLMEDTRTALEPRRSPVRRAAEAVALRGVLPHRHVLGAVTRALAVAQRAHLVPRRFGLPHLPVRSPAPLTADPDPDPDAYLFTGCVMDAWQRDVHRAALRLMRATGARVGLPGPGADCCGALHVHAGRRADAERLARRTIDAFPGDAPIVVDSAGCGAALADYGHLLGTDAARSFAARVVDVSTWLSTAELPELRPGTTTVVVQDPCHLRHVQKAHLPVAALLGRAYDVRLTGDDGLCCGAGGAYSAFEPALSEAVRARKVDALRAAASGRPFVVASANPGCALHLAAAGLTVRHPVELLEACLGPD
jgi:glycolate oxidase iron-sulfur subunit